MLIDEFRVIARRAWLTCSPGCTGTGWWWCWAAAPTRWRRRSTSPAGSGRGPSWWARPWPTCSPPPVGQRGAGRAARGQRVPDAPRPVPASDLLPERALDGDPAAREQLIAEVYEPLIGGGSALLDTVMTYLEHGNSLEATARLLFVHPNTVRYRLRRAS